MLALFRRWSVVILVMVAVVYLNQTVPLSPEEIATVRTPYTQSYDIARVYAKHHISGKLMISVVASPKASSEIQRINILYDRSRASMEAASTEPYFESPLPWLLRVVVIVLLISAWLLYLDPLLAGRICPHCRRWGWLSQILRERERTVHPAALDDKGGYWSEVIETERYCPTCSFRQFTIRQYTPSVQQDLATADMVNDYRLSDEELEARRRMIEEKIKKGIPSEVYLARLEAARQDAAAKSTPRE